MDPISAGASVLAFVGVAEKLVSSLKKLHEFWSSIKDAPTDVRTIANETKILAGILEDIAADQNVYSFHLPTREALSHSFTLVEKLTATIKELEPGINASRWSVRKWTSVKSVLKKEKIRSIKRAIAEIKASLTLCLLTASR